jgi:N4-gp56 family major capsid protein
MPLNTRASLPNAVRDYYDRVLLTTAYPCLIHTRFAQQRVMPLNSGDTIIFRRYNKLATVPVPLQDGITPPGALLSAQDVKARVQFYGNYVMITNEVELTAEDYTLNQAARLLAQNLGQTLDEITYDVLANSTSVILATGGSNGQTPTNLSKADIDAAVKTLLQNDAKMITEVIPGRDAYDTHPIRPSFWGMIPTALIDDLEKVSNFIATANYAQQGPVMPCEWGNTGNVRWVFTSVQPSNGATIPVYTLPIVGQDAYAVVHLGSESGDFYVNPLGSAGSADPLHQRGTVGWMHPFAARILNDAFMVNLLVTHT